MILYHGTNIDFPKIDLSKCSPNKDFGKGFYLTSLYQQAVSMSIRRCELERKGTPIVQVYEINDDILTSNILKVKSFKGVSKEWAEFILMNRNSNGRNLHNYDIVIGPVADDGVVYQLNLYIQHLISLE